MGRSGRQSLRLALKPNATEYEAAGRLEDNVASPLTKGCAKRDRSIRKSAGVDGVNVQMNERDAVGDSLNSNERIAVGRKQRCELTDFAAAFRQ